MGNSAFGALTVLEDGSYPGGFVELGVGVPIITGAWEASPVDVQWGGTGATSFTPYTVICGGATSSGILENVPTVGTSGQVLTSNGAAMLPSWATPTTGTVTSVTGTALQIDVATGTTTPVISIDAGYVGQTSITTLGTIATGVWNGSVISSTYGGSGVANPTIHGVLIAEGTSPFTSIVLGAGQVLIGTTSSDPTAAAIAGTANQITVTSATGSITASIPNAVIFPGTVTLNADPTTSLQAATKQYVDNIAAGLQVQPSCYAGTTANLTATYSNGVSGVGATLTNSGTQVAFSTDGVSPPINSRVLVKNQSSSFQNGIYTLTTVGTGSTNWLLTRATNYNNTTEITPGDFILLDNGSTLQYTAWIQTATVTVIGTDAINFTQFGASNVLSVSGTTNRITSTGGTAPVIDISASYVGQASITTLGTITSGVWNGTSITVPNGGTGNTTFTSYSLICAGTTATGTFQNVSGVGSSGQVLTSNGASALPTWQPSSTGTVTSVSGTALQIDVATGTTTPVISIDTGYVGQTSITTLGTITTGVWNGTLIALAHGGTNANLTASNGGIFYSTASAGAILAGTSTANQVLLSGASTTPAWSTATYPATTTASQLLYSSTTNTVGGLTTANSAVLVTSSAGVPVFSGTMTNGQLIIGSTSGTPTAATLSQGTGITITNSAGSITIASTSVGPTWTNQTSSTTMAVNTYYIANSGSLVTLTLPATAAQGTVFAVAGVGAGGWKVGQAASQQINFGNVTTTSGTGGSLASSNQYDVVYLLCTTANTQFSVLSSVGNLTYV